MRLARYEALIERQPFLLNSVLLRQNISNVHEWHKRVALYQERGDAAQVVATYTEALTSVDAAAADGKLHSLWVAFAKWYEAQAQLDTARDILQRATAAPYHAVDELVTVHCEAAELELRHGEPQRALDLIKNAIANARPASLARGGGAASLAAKRLNRSVRLWNMYVDLEESVGTFESTCAAYDEMMRVKVATPQTVLNYTEYLQTHKHWEKSFQVFERAVAAFSFPFARDIWASYLTQFVQRYGMFLQYIHICMRIYFKSKD